MSPLTDWKRRRREFPPAMRRLVDNELRAGNRILEVSSTPPAPAFGAVVRLAGPVRSCPRLSQGELHYQFAPGPSHSGEWFDLCRHFFVLEPPDAPPPPASPTAGAGAASPPDDPSSAAPIPAPTPPAEPAGTDLVRQFESSRNLNYERWRDGESYALHLLPQMSAAERARIEESLVYSTISDWRHVEALAVLATPAADRALRRAFTNEALVVRAAVLRYAPHLISEEEQVAHLLTALQQADFFHGLTETAEAIRRFHPPIIVAAIHAALLERSGPVAQFLARLLLEIHGLAQDLFDPAQRAFLLRFNTDNVEARRAAQADLRQLLESHQS